MSKQIWNKHHLIYGPGKGSQNREVTRYVRRGLHQVLTLIRRFRHLTDEEINAVHIECELKRQFTQAEEKSD